jgi:hypothetical protein
MCPMCLASESISPWQLFMAAEIGLCISCPDNPRRQEPALSRYLEHWRGTAARHWNAAEDALLISLRLAGTQWIEIAALLNRPSGPTCRLRHEMLRQREADAATEAADAAMRAARAKPRTCLRCRGVFDSQSASNRICPRCHDAANEIDKSTWIYRPAAHAGVPV